MDPLGRWGSAYAMGSQALVTSKGVLTAGVQTINKKQKNIKVKKIQGKEN